MGQLPVFLGDNLWEKLQAEAKKVGRKDIAVAYITEANSVPLGRKDRVLADFSEVSVRAGKSDPKVALKALKNGAEIYNDSKLHAKVYILQDCVIVGSANLSNSSKNMHEAGMLDSSLELHQNASEWFENNLKHRNPMTEQELKKLAHLFATERAILTNGKGGVSIYEALKTNHPILQDYVFSWWYGNVELTDKQVKKSLEKKRDLKSVQIFKNWENLHRYEQLNKRGIIEDLRKTFSGKPQILFEAHVDDDENINKFGGSICCESYHDSVVVLDKIEIFNTPDFSHPGVVLDKPKNKELPDILTRGIKRLGALKKEISIRSTGEIKLEELKAIFKKGESL